MQSTYDTDVLKDMFDKSKLKYYEKKDFDLLTEKLSKHFFEHFKLDKESLPKEARIKKVVFGLGEKELPDFSVLTSDKILKTLTEEQQSVAKTFKKFLDIFNRKEIMTSKTKVAVNVLIAAPVACTFLNVIYGKFVKALKGEHKQEAKEVK